MALQPSTRLGPYEIQSQLGAGGMGEVYKATDTRLDRTVAIKVLPAHVADDRDLRQRFEREAKTISSLSHPHICTLHDIGQQDGMDYLVMEYLEGETLAARLTKGPLPTEQVLRYATEIADALDKAHRKGITHRDLKPGNIMLTKGGTKLLDFGLAKLKQPAAGGPGVTAVPTVSAGLTAQGTILGTLQYMAPEQLEGLAVDARADIFALGTVLYEMVTGRKAFEGRSHASLVSAILKDDPPSISVLQPMTPTALDRLVKKCLAKDPEDRYHSAHDLADELNWVAEEHERPTPSAVAPAATGTAVEGISQPSVAMRVATAPRPGSWRRALAWAAGVAVGSLITGVVVWSLMRPVPPAPQPLEQFVVITPPDGPLTLTNNHPDVAISPDGTRIVYASGTGPGRGRQLYLRQLGQLNATPVRGTEAGSVPFFSPDGEWVGFRTTPDSSLKKVSVLGGPPVTICVLEASLRGASWGRDDTIVFATAASQGLMRVPAVGGEPAVLTTVDPEQSETDHWWPEVLPNGKGVLFTAWSGSAEGSRLAVVSLETGEITYLLPGGSNPHYSPTGHIVYGVGGTLRAVGFDADRLALTSNNPVPVVENVNTKDFTGAANFSVSGNGALVYLSGVGAGGAQRSLVWVDRDGREEPLDSPLLAYERPRVSPDGTRVAVDVAEPEGADIWIHDLRRGTETRLTTDPANDRAPLWTPDGERVVFESNREGQPALFWKLADTPGEAERLMSGREGSVGIEATAWSADGQTLLLSDLTPPSPDIGLLSMEGERTSELLLATEFSEAAPAISPDGGWIAYDSNETGEAEVYVQRFPELGGKVTISTDGGRLPLWSPDGRELFYRGPRGMMVVPVEIEPTFRAGDPEVLFEQQYFFFRSRRTYDVAPDGQRFLMVKEGVATTDSSAPAEIILVQHWFDELQRLVPTP